MQMKGIRQIITRSIYTIHRILGTFLSILFLMWFLSGLVMMYHTFPKVWDKEKLQKTEILDSLLPPIETIAGRIPSDQKIKNIEVSRFLNQTVFRIQTNKQVYLLPANSTEQLQEISHERIYQIAQKWNSSSINRIDTLHELDQWTPFEELKKELPFIKFYFSDNEKHELYISSRTGEVLQYTTQKERFWSWMGAIPHWVYFTSLRQDQALWTKSIIFLSVLGIIMTLAGLYVGIHAYIQCRKNKCSFKSPYKKRWYWLHHITGLIFGLFVLTWIFSGMMSVTETPNWIIKKKEHYPIEKILEGDGIRPELYTLDYREVISLLSGTIKKIEWGRFHDKPLYHIVTTSKKITLDASSNKILPLNLKEKEITKAIESIHGKGSTKTTFLKEYDTYYLAKSGHLPLPVYKLEIADADNSCYYVNPKNGQYRYYNNRKRWDFWLYKGMHGLTFQFLVTRPLLRLTVLWILMLGGTVVSVSGVVLGARYVIRKIRRLNLRKQKKLNK